MKYKLLLLVLSISTISYAQSHTKVAGTKCKLVPPDGFESSQNFSGFKNVATGATIMINEIPAPYTSIIEGFTTAALKSRGMRLINKQTIVHNNQKATYVTISQPANGTTYLKQILIFGDSSVTILVNGIYPEALKNNADNIKAALLTTIYDTAQNENPLDAVNFSIDVAGSDFKLIKYLSGSLLYSTDGKIPTDSPTLIVGNSISKVAITNQQLYAEERLKKLPGADSIYIKETHKINIDSLGGYEIIAEVNAKNGSPELIYQVMLFNNDDDYFILVGNTRSNFEKYITIFRSIANTFKRK